MRDENEDVCHVSRRDFNKSLLLGSAALIASDLIKREAIGEVSVSELETASESVRLVHQREWHIGESSNAIHVLGNGHAMVHQVGPNILFFRGPWISSPNLITMFLTGPVEIRSVSSREEKTAIWHHKLYRGGKQVGEIVDYLHEEQPCLRRRIASSVELEFAVKSPRLIDYSARYPNHTALVGQWPLGKDFILVNSPTLDPFTVQFVLPQSARVRGPGRDENAACRSKLTLSRMASRTPEQMFMLEDAFETSLSLPSGSYELLIIAGAGFPESFATADQVLAVPTAEALKVTRKAWSNRLSKGSFSGTNDATSEIVAPVVDDIATLLLSQQSKAGAIIPGCLFPMFHPRDQYNMSRALLAIGMVDEARKMLHYFWQAWAAHGIIHNCQSDGPRYYFVMSDNDEVEITGYLVVQAFDYLEASGDDAFIKEISPMLEWALDAQERHIVAGMLPFNGDETYQWMIPDFRRRLNDGSSEATLLYAAGADRMCEWAAARASWSAERISNRCKMLALVRESYVRNFAKHGKLIANNPERSRLAVLPRLRGGRCMGLYDDQCLMMGGFNQLAEDGRYFCLSCYPKRTFEKYEPKAFSLPSVTLASRFIEYDMAPRNVLSATLSEAVSVYFKEGRFTWPKEVIVGHEMGLISIALMQDRHPLTPEFIRRLLELRDATGVWAEGYENGAPLSCRANTMESGLNLIALIKAANLPIKI